MRGRRLASSISCRLAARYPCARSASTGAVRILLFLVAGTSPHRNQWVPGPAGPSSLFLAFNNHTQSFLERRQLLASEIKHYLKLGAALQDDACPRFQLSFLANLRHIVLFHFDFLLPGYASKSYRSTDGHVNNQV